MFRNLMIIGAVLAIAGCEAVKGPAPDGVTANFKGESSKAFVAGYQPVKVKTVKDGKEVPAACQITSTKFQASFTTPATVNLPAYSKDPVDATLTCTYEGASKTETFEPVNLSKQARAGNSLGTFVLCPICGIVGAAATSAAADKETDIFGHTEMKIDL